MPTAKIIVGYRTRTVEPDVLESLIPTFTPQRNLKDPEKIAADVEEKRRAFLEEAKDQPYTGTFDDVILVGPGKKKVVRFSYEGREPGASKARICVAVAQWLLSNYPDAWSWDSHDTRKPEAVFIGFNPRLFLKMLGEECSLPGVDRPLPLRLWYSNSDHRDVEEAVMPRDFKRLTFETVLRSRRPVREASAKAWDRAVEGWTGPGVDPEKDVILATELATQLGFFKE